MEAFAQALKKQATNWDEWGSVRPLADEQADDILSDPVKRKRCMRSRVCYRDKNPGGKELQAKARPVILGFNDPDLKSLRRNASALRRASIFLIL